MESIERMNVSCGCMPVVDVTFDREADSIPLAIIDALATAADVDPMDLPPLYEVVDPDAIERLFSSNDRSDPGNMVLSFQVREWNVFLSGEGRIRVCDATHPTDPVPIFGPQLS